MRRECGIGEIERAGAGLGPQRRLCEHMDDAGVRRVLAGSAADAVQAFELACGPGASAEAAGAVEGLGLDAFAGLGFVPGGACAGDGVGVREVFRAEMDVAQAIVRDGEGATKFVTVEVNGGGNHQECLDVGYTVAHSPLIKTALFASDPNWGRILAAVGRAGVPDLDVSKIDVFLGDVCIASRGARAETYTEAQGSAVMQQEEITIRIELGRGACSETIWTTDLSHEYVKINAEYRT